MRAGSESNPRNIVKLALTPGDATRIKTLQRDAQSFRLPASDWYNLWHTHVDWDGEGNRDPEVRRACLMALVTMLRVRARLTDEDGAQICPRFERDDRAKTQA